MTTAKNNMDGLFDGEGAIALIFELIMFIPSTIYFIDAWFGEQE